MIRIIFITLAALSTSLITSARNILIVMTDDMIAPTELPNHDFFKSANVLNAITSVPVCGPARAAFLTGLRPDTTKIYNFETYLNRETMFSYFKKLKYDTFVTGKVFHTLRPDLTKQFEYKIGALTSERSCLQSGNSGCKGNRFFCNIKVSEDRCSIDNVINFFKTRTTGKNWIAGVGFHRPHLLISNSKKATVLTHPHNILDFSKPIIYENGKPINFDYSLSNLQHSGIGNIKVPINRVFEPIVKYPRKYPSHLFTNKYRKTVLSMRKAYYSSIQETLQNFLEIVDSMYAILPNSKFDTDIIFISDHGFQIGQRGILGKNTLYPESTNIPLFFKIGGESTKRPISKSIYFSSIDVFPTLIQLHQQKTASNLDGVSIIGTTQPIAISQYPRCQQLGVIQTEDCMTSISTCNRPIIQYMGYLIVHEINGVIYRYSEWYPFKEVRKKCEWPNWPNMPISLVNNLGYGPVWTMELESSTDFSKESIHRELYIDGTNTNLVMKLPSVVNILSDLIKKIN